MKDVIENLSKLDLSNYPVFDIQNELSKSNELGILVITLHKGKYIHRARNNETEDHFTSKADLTYRPKQLNKNCQRANLPNTSMFYGSILPEEIETDDLDQVRFTPLFEIQPLIRDKTSKGIKNITFSKWVVKEDIKLVAVLQHGNFYDKSSYTKKMVDEFNLFLNKNPSKKEDTINFLTFLSNEFAKEDIKGDYDYLISASFTEKMIQMGFDGVLYPSVRIDGKGFNIAITPQVADQKIDLEVVLHCTLFKNNELAILNNNFYSKLYSNQTHWEMKKIEKEFQRSLEDCLNAVKVESLDELK